MGLTIPRLVLPQERAVDGLEVCGVAGYELLAQPTQPIRKNTSPFPRFADSPFLSPFPIHLPSVFSFLFNKSTT